MEEISLENDRNILAVDDSPVNLRLLVGILSSRGYKVRPVTSGQLAISAAIGLPPDLILLDINMPEMDGYTVCEKLKSDPRTKDIPVIFISALNEAIDKVKSFKVGGVDYITKPFEVEETLMRVKTHIDINRLQKNLQEKNQELQTAIEQLKSAESQLIQSEKMAALGQLIAGIAHEINTPLGAIKSSGENIDDFLKNKLSKILHLLKNIPETQQEFLLNFCRQQNKTQEIELSTREKRQIKRKLTAQLQIENINNAEHIADTLSDIGIHDQLTELLPILTSAKSNEILETAYELYSVQRSSKTIITAAEKTTKIVFALKNYARYDHEGKKVLFNIIEGLETVLILYQNKIKHGVELIKKYPEKLPLIMCYADELNQVWTNLIHNALQAMEYQGKLILELQEESEYITVTITDSGPGIPSEIMPKIFEPFFTTKPPGEGSGIGLDIVKKIIIKHHGKIDVKSEPGQTVFKVFIPIADQ
jgi:two-component system, NtrC family, sensor kinase